MTYDLLLSFKRCTFGIAHSYSFFSFLFHSQPFKAFETKCLTLKKKKKRKFPAACFLVGVFYSFPTPPYFFFFFICSTPVSMNISISLVPQT